MVSQSTKTEVSRSVVFIDEQVYHCWNYIKAPVIQIFRSMQTIEYLEIIYY